MVDDIVKIERERLADLGFGSIVTPVTITIDKPIKILHLANESYVLSGIRVSNNNLVDDANMVQISSPSDEVEMSMREMSTMGEAINRLFKNYIIIKTLTNNGFEKDANIVPYRLEFVRISPVKR